MKYLYIFIVIFIILIIFYILQQKNIENFDSRNIYYKTMPYQCNLKQYIDLSKNTPFAPI